MTERWILFVFVSVTVITTSRCQVLQQSDIDRIAEDLKVKAKVLDNTIKSTISHDVRITLENTGSSDLPSSGWILYFHSFFLLFPTVFPRPKFTDLELEKVKVSIIQGDLYSIQPIVGFTAIKPNSSREIDITVAVWSISRTDFMPQWYLTGDDVSLEPRIVQSTASMDVTYVEPFDDVRQWKRYNSDRYNPYTAQQRLRRIQVEDTGKVEKLVIPTPKTMTVATGSDITLTIDNTWQIYNESSETSSVARYLSDMLNISITNTASLIKTITLKVTPTIGTVPEAYNLDILPNQTTVRLEGKDARGLFYAVQSLLSILDGYYKLNIPEIRISDEPRFPLRGMHVDVARNFHGVDDIKRILSAMAMYKLNTLHLHLTDDEGWRLEIPSIPELAEVGGKRCHDLTEERCVIPQYGSGPFINSSTGSGFYTVDEYRSILRHAAERHIEVIPEFDMPGHAHSAIIAMEKRYKYHMDGNMTAATQYRLVDPYDTSHYLSFQNWMDNAINPCMESTYDLIGRILDDVIDMHSDIQPLKTYHFGGDEVAGGAWENSTICNEFLQQNPSYNVSKGLKKYFAERVSNLTRDRGVAIQGWEDGFISGDGRPFPLSSQGNPNVTANAWDNVWEWGASPRPHTFANAGYKVVMSQATHFYFDHPYEPDPEERGLYWAPRFTDTYKTFTFMPDSLFDNIDVRRSGEPLTIADVCGANMEKCDALEKPENILGIQGQLWSETVRTSENLDYMIFPRLLALAERAWHKAAFESSSGAERNDLISQEWKAFANTIGYKELARLESYGIKYRVPPPGARVQNGKIEVATTFPGLKTEISLNKGMTWSEISPANQPSFPATGTVHLRTKSKDNQRYSRHIELFKDEPLMWSDQSVIDYIGQYVEVYVAVVDNLNKTDNFMTMELHLTNTGSDVVRAGTWKIYLYSLYGLKLEILDCGLRTGHVNGGLFYVTPNDSSFPGIQPGQKLQCIFHNQYWSVTRTDQFPNWYTSSLGMIPKVIKNTADDTLSFVGTFDTDRQWKRSTEDRYNPLTAEERYTMFEMERKSTAPNTAMVLPSPFDVTSDPSSSLTVGSGWVVVNSSDFSFAATQISAKLNLPLQSMTPQDRYISFVRGPTDFNVTESYHVTVNPMVPAIMIKANDSPGALYAAQTVIALVQNHDGKLMNMTIKDKPRFAYRGLMIDTARNFKPKEWIYKMLDMMVMYKMNKLHFHLTDDEGWRLEIPGIPELTQVSGNRCHSDYKDTCVIPQLGSGPTSKEPGSGFYTAQDYKDILKYASDRHIEVIPEVDMPGHSTAAIQAMSQREATIKKQTMHGAGNVDDSFALTDADENSNAQSPQKWRLNAMNPCLNTTYEFVRALVEGIKSLHEVHQPLKSFHIGGDEVPDGIWDTSAACKEKFSNLTTQSLQREFVKKVAEIVASFGLDLAVWEDGVYADNRPNPITDYKSPNVYVYPWNSRWELGKAQRASEFADEGYKVILPLATHLYLDMPQEQDPEERGLYWASRVTDVRKVFGFMPDDIFANADVTRMGVPVTLPDICNNRPCPMPTKPENIIGMQGVMFSETMRTEEQFHHMGFPRILAIAERAWHKASWEDISNVTSRNSSLATDFASFVKILGEKELKRLEDNEVMYRVPPPGAKIEGNSLIVNTRFPDHPVEFSTNNGQSWKKIQGNTQYIPEGAYKIQLRSRSPVLNRYSRVIEVKANIVTSSMSRYTPTAWLVVTIATVIIAFVHF